MGKWNNYFRTLLVLGAIVLFGRANGQDPNFHIYLCFGQSNMEGQGTIEEIDKTVNDRFQVMSAVDCSSLRRSKGNWYPAVPPLCRCWTGLCPADYFGRTMVLNLPDSIKIGVVNVSVAGCKIELFEKDDYQDYASTVQSWMANIIAEYDENPYQCFVDLAQLAQQEGVIKGILLHQGESNTGDSQWPEKVKGVYDSLLTDLKLEADSIPLLAGEVVHADQGGICASMNSIIAKLPNKIPNSYVISSQGCSDKDDNLHFNSAGYRELGKRYAAQMLSIMDYDTANLEYPAAVTELEQTLRLSDNFKLKDNYPNPFNPTTSITYQLPRNVKVSLEILDVTGRVIETLVDDIKRSGKHSITFDGSNISSGIYFYKLKTATGFQQSKKMLLVK